MELDPNLVVVSLDQCDPAELCKNSCLYTIPSAPCGPDVHQLATSVQCFSGLEQTLSHIQSLQIPQVQPTFDDGILTGSAPLYQNSTFQSFSSSFVPPIPADSSPFFLLTSAEIEQDLAPQATEDDERKHPTDEYEYYKEIEDYLFKNVLPEGYSDIYYRNLKKRSQHYLMHNGELHHNPKNPKRVIMMKEKQDEILKNTHIVPSNGIHLGIKKMVNFLEEKYFWRGLYTSVSQYVKNCVQCREKNDFFSNLAIQNESSSENNKNRVKINTTGIQTVSNVWAKVEIAINGPFKITNLRNEYIMSIVDPETCFILAMPITNNGHSTKLTQFMLQTFYTFGFPKTAEVVASDLLFEAVSTEFVWRLSNFSDAKKYLKKREKAQNVWVGELFELLKKRHAMNWDRELGQFLYQFRMGGINQFANSAFCPFYAMYHRIPELFLNEENKENQFEGPKNNSFFKSQIESNQQQLNDFGETLPSLVLEEPQYSVEDPDTSQNSSLSISDSDQTAVECGLDLTTETDDTIEGNVKCIKEFLAETKDLRRRRGKYQKYSAELQNTIANYSLKHGSQNAAIYFTRLLKAPISESTIRSIVKSYGEFMPALKEEIANYAVIHGVEKTAKHYSEKLKKRVTECLVRRFKTLYIKKPECKTTTTELNSKTEPNASEFAKEYPQDNLDLTDCFEPIVSIDPKLDTENLNKTYSIDSSTNQFLKTVEYQNSSSSSLPLFSQLDNLNLNTSLPIYQTPFTQTPVGLSHPGNMDIGQALQSPIVLVTNENYDSTVLPDKPEQIEWPPDLQPINNSIQETVFIDPMGEASQEEEEEEDIVYFPIDSPPIVKRKKRPKNSKEPRGKKRGRYTFYSPELRAEIGKYAAEHGSLKASNHFSKILGHDLPESTARGYKEKYLKKLKHCDVTTLGYSQRGRPVRLGKYDEVVQECLKELIKSGEKVTSFLAITTAKQILNKYEPGLLQENGGNVVLNTTWAKSVLRRIGVHNSS
ncbi:uncharacterized protein LOC106668790 isoform X2 [Cimex lectularius]|uniref:Integrase zinc-binding domain-containing protein n=1 Tax=Cimex lectularius TaxID=79782 RepID=A0A8I6RXR1_CIMLE|nr:uncharacterized protein LOC106668790 isoform X2 [Cimex lectularius]